MRSFGLATVNAFAIKITTCFFQTETLPELLPASNGNELEQWVRDDATTYWHQTCMAKMGQDAMSVVDGQLRVYGIDRLRVANGSVLPRITTGNTMAPSVMIEERAGDLPREQRSL